MKNGWIKSKDFGCYIKQNNAFQPPSEMALGDKLIYWQAGIDTESSHLRGSTIDDWGGYHFGQNLQEALDWLKTDSKEDTSYWINRY